MLDPLFLLIVFLCLFNMGLMYQIYVKNEKIDLLIFRLENEQEELRRVSLWEHVFYKEVQRLNKIVKPDIHVLRPPPEVLPLFPKNPEKR